MLDGSATMEPQSIKLGEERREQNITNLYLCCTDCKTVESWTMMNNVTKEVITDARIECTAEGE